MDKDVRKYLIELARIRRTVPYGKAMEQFGYNVSFQNQIDFFADIIGDISVYENQFDRPMLSSLIVHASGTTIGKGFYRLAEELQYGDKNHLFKTRFERQMQEWCYNYWRDPDNYKNHSNPASDDIFTFLIRDDNFPEGFDSVPVSRFDFSGIDTDWAKKHADDMETGLMGENLVIEYEKHLLKKNGQSKLASSVQKVKDGKGYDIISIDIEGNPKYIEVKTTTSNAGNPFSISINEVMFSEKHARNYYLYRLYNLDKINNTAKFNEYKGNLRELFFFQPIQFDAFRIRK